MKRKVGVLSALAIVASQVGGTGAAIGQDALSIELACAQISTMNDRAELQTLLGTLLDNDPSNLCIDQIVQRLGGGPIAQIAPVDDPY